MYNLILGILTVIVALIVAILAFALPPEKLETVILISRFFEIMLPILGVGALLKYLFWYGPETRANLIKEGIINSDNNINKPTL